MSASAGDADTIRGTHASQSCSGGEAEGVEAAEGGGGGRVGSDGVGGIREGMAGGVETWRRLMQSALLFDVDGEKPLVYSEEYNVRLFGVEKLHPFDSVKWSRIVHFLIHDGHIQPHQVVEPRAATNDDLLLVHSQEYLNSLRSSFNLAIIGELPPLALFPNFVLQHRVVRPFRYQVGGSVMAAKLAMERGAAVNVGGGLHHCSRHRGMGFCALADISAVVTFARAFLGVKRVLIVDLDAHQGNGHETDLMGDVDVFIVDVYNAGIFPQDHEAKAAIRIAKELRSGTGTRHYLDVVAQALQEVSASVFRADLLVYNAGTDILANDPLGRLAVSAEGVQQRDEMVFQFAKDHSLPIVMLTSGGYQPNNARIVADSLANLSAKHLLPLQVPPAPY
ncbi:hypothetical protein CLOM_g24222 [Closterium sp. NIES-68]|nr:hypothetical protein CLOM_g24222 [Closterium sp. NIES-68]